MVKVSVIKTQPTPTPSIKPSPNLSPIGQTENGGNSGSNNPNTYTLNFETNGGSTIASQTLN